MTPDECWLSADEQAAWRGWLDTYRLLIPALDRQLQASRVSFTEYEVLVCLSEATDQRLRMSEVADRTLATRSAITRTVDRLVARGWVRRVRSTHDQRGAYAALTQPGAQALAELAPGHVKAVRQNLIDLLTPAELEALRTIGRRVKDRLAGRDGWSPRTSFVETDARDDAPDETDETGEAAETAQTTGPDPTGSDWRETDLPGPDSPGWEPPGWEPPGSELPGPGLPGSEPPAPGIAGPDR
jgi:DNA-binding MarR family transcriptional regulator